MWPARPEPPRESTQDLFGQTGASRLRAPPEHILQAGSGSKNTAASISGRPCLRWLHGPPGPRGPQGRPPRHVDAGWKPSLAGRGGHAPDRSTARSPDKAATRFHQHTWPISQNVTNCFRNSDRKINMQPGPRPASRLLAQATATGALGFGTRKDTWQGPGVMRGWWAWWPSPPPTAVMGHGDAGLAG